MKTPRTRVARALHLALACGLAGALAAGAAHAVTGNFDAGFEIVDINGTTPVQAGPGPGGKILDFGTIEYNAPGCTGYVTVGVNGQLNGIQLDADPGCPLPTVTGTPKAAEFEATGAAGSAYYIVLPNQVSIQGSMGVPPSLDATEFTSFPESKGGGETQYGVIGPGGTDTFIVGAKLTVPDQSQGNFQKALNIDLQFYP